MEFISAREFSNKWNISVQDVSLLCTEKKIKNATMVGNMWLIPSNTDRPLCVNNPLYDFNKTKISKPFVKWAGGKTQLINEIQQYYPFDNTITKYVEPFVGGGAVLFDILSKFELEQVYINDFNSELINTYKVIRDNIDHLIITLSAIESDYLSLDANQQKSFYLRKRDIFNTLKLCRSISNNTEKAALFIFLNKTCFNGLYRVNKTGLFNVPIGSYKNPKICDTNNLYNVSDKLKNVNILCGDFKDTLKHIDNKTFVYLDPPYRPITKTSAFTSYTEEIFDDNKHIELANFVDSINNKNAKFLLSNSDPKNSDETDTFFDNLYSKYKINRVNASRMINCNGNLRGKIKELIISNI